MKKNLIILTILFSLLTIHTKAQTKVFRPGTITLDVWKPNTGTWQYSDRVYNSYDNKTKNLTNRAEKAWDSSQKVWKDFTTDSFKYDSLGRQIEVVTKRWDTALLQYVNISRITDSFTKNNRIETAFNWDGSIWFPIFQDKFTMDKTTGDDTLMQHMIWNTTKWVNSVRYQKSFNSMHIPRLVLTSQWDGVKWVLTEKEKMYEDTLYVHKILDTNNTWQYVYLQRGINTFNASKLRIEREEFGSYDSVKFEPFGHKYFYYDANGNDTQQVVQEWDATVSKYINVVRITVNVQEWVGLKQDQPLTNNIEIYPNPTRDKINILTQTTGNVDVMVYDITGKIVTNKTLYHKSGLYQLDLSNQAKGVYFIKCNYGNKVVLKKICLE